MEGDIALDNRWVVPHNLHLLKKYQAHINLEVCNKGHLLKYLFKYVTKGPDCAKMYLERVRNGQDAPHNSDNDTIDEVREYLLCRYICDPDACWRIIGFEIHAHLPAVERMHVHLPGENYVAYKEGQNLTQMLNDSRLTKIMFTEWFNFNRQYVDGLDLTYCEFPTRFTWQEKDRYWKPREGSCKIDRLYFVHPSTGERYFLRMLLMVVKDAFCYSDLGGVWIL